MAGGAMTAGYEWKWPWNANSHHMSASISENDDLLIYSPISLFCPLFPSFSYYHNRYHHLLLSFYPFLFHIFFPSVHLNWTFSSSDFSPLVVVILHLIILFLLWPSLAVTPEFTKTTLDLHISFDISSVWTMWEMQFCVLYTKMYANYILWQRCSRKEQCTGK